MLKTDYQNYIPSENMGGRKHYQLVNNDDGTVSLIDTTEYAIVGNKFGATDINNTNEKINSLYGFIIANIGLSPSVWSNGVYTISNANIKADNTIFVLPGLNLTTAQVEALQEAIILDNGQSAGQLKLKAYGTVPTITIPIRLIIKNDGRF